jgi:hypothetical protein
LLSMKKILMQFVLIKMDEEIKTFPQIIALTENSDTNQMQSEILKPTDSTEKENTYLLDDNNDSDGFRHHSRQLL